MCPTGDFIEKFDKLSKCYAVNAVDNIRLDSSSGGVFKVLAKYFFENQGYVCGAAFDDKWKLAHIVISSEDDLYRLQKSKYIQSNMEHVWGNLAVLSKKLVLFTGTPCQCAAA